MNQNINQVLTAVLIVVALLTGQEAWAWDGEGTSASLRGNYYYNGKVYYNASKGYIVGPTTWTALQAALTAASTDADNPTVITLAADITAEAGDSYLNLEGGRKVILDLNGHTLDRHLTEAKTNTLNYGSLGCTICVSGSNTSLTIRDSGTNGTITGGWSTSGAGCINATNGATLRLESGTISGNRVQGQGGAIYFSGNFYMTGGTITGNAANLVNNNNIRTGSAIFFGSSGDFYMTGGSITGNYCGTTGYGTAGIGCYNGSYTFNVHLSGTYDIGGNQQGTYDSSNGTWSNLSPSDILNHDHMTYVIDGVISPSQTARMIVDAHDSKATITSGWSTYMDGEDPEDYFILANPNGQGIGLNASGEATIGTLHTITLADGLTATATQAAPGRPITLSGGTPSLSHYIVTYNDGKVHTDYYYADTNGNAIFHMPNADASISSEAAVTYIDEKGDLQTCTNFTLIESHEGDIEIGNSDNKEKWYAVNGPVTIHGRLQILDQNIHLILCDGASFTVTNATSSAIRCSKNVTIYGQSAQSGTITAPATSSEYPSIDVSAHALTINGGTINATSDNASAIYARTLTINRGTVNVTGYYGINCSKDVTINGGTVNAHGSDNYSAIYGNNDVTINGGIIDAESPTKAIYAQNGILTLGWTNATDRITASSYYTKTGTICVKDGQILTDGTNYYSGTPTNEQLAAMAGQTLQPAVALAMNSVGIMTYASPYALDLSNVNAYVISDYDNTNSTLTLTLSKVTEAPANTGLLLKAKEDSQKDKTIGLPLKENAASVGTNLLVGVTDGATIVSQTDGPKTNFILANGKYGIDWYTLSADGAIGSNKAYLQLLTAQLPSLAREFTWVYEGETTEIGTITNNREPITNNQWYTLDGRKLSGKPTTKGLYIHNGRKVVVK